MKKWSFHVLVLLLLGSLPLTLAARSHHQSGKTDAPLGRLLAFDRMYGVDGPFVGEAHPIRGVVGDELPWTITGFARGRLDTNGHLRIQVKGLVFTDDPVVPPELQGKNDEESFRALVSCTTELSETESGTANVVTDPFPATPEGDSTIDAFIELPNPCIAPIVFILAGSEDKWFAVDGFESED
jgi:hypothetical protein